MQMLQRRTSAGIDRDADQSAGHRSPVPIGGREKPRVRTAEPDGHAEALRRADHRIDAPCAGRLDQTQPEQVGDDDAERTRRAECVDRRARVDDGTGRSGQCEHRTEHIGCVQVDGGIADHQFDANGFGAGRDDGQGLRMHAAVDEEPLRGRADGSSGHRHRLGRGGALVEHRRVRQVEPGQVGDERLEVDQRLQATLRDLRLVWRVGRVPRGVLEDVALDHARHSGGRVAHADHRGDHTVGCRKGGDRLERLGLGASVRQVEQRTVADRIGHDRVEKLVHARDAQRREHGGHLIGVGSEVARREGRVGVWGSGHGRLLGSPLSSAPESFAATNRAFSVGGPRETASFQSRLRRAVREPESFRDVAPSVIARSDALPPDIIGFGCRPAC